MLAATSMSVVARSCSLLSPACRVAARTGCAYEWGHTPRPAGRHPSAQCLVDGRGIWRGERFDAWHGHLMLRFSNHYDASKPEAQGVGTEAGTPRPGSPARGSGSGRPVMAVLDLLGRRWTLRILWESSQAPSHFRELRRHCESMPSSVLSTRLGEPTGARVLTLHGDAHHLTQLGEDPDAGGGSERAVNPGRAGVSRQYPSRASRCPRCRDARCRRRAARCCGAPVAGRASPPSAPTTEREGRVRGRHPAPVE